MGKGKKKKLWIILLAAMIVVLGGMAVEKTSRSKTEAGMPVNIVGVVKQDIESHIQTNGEVLSIDKREIVSDVEGKIKEVFVQEGDKVEKGQILVTLDPSEIHDQIKQAEINLAIEEATLEKLQKGDRLDLETALRNAEIEHKDAKDHYERTRQLYEGGAVSKKELDLAKSKLDQMDNALALAQKNLENADEISEIAIQEKQIELSRLTLQKLKRELEKYTIRSPISGTVVDMSLVEGKSVTGNTPLMVIQDTEQLEVVANVSEYDVHKIEIGDAVKITGDAIEGKEYQGKVKYISPTATSISTGQGKETVVEIKIGINRKDTDLKPGFSANVDILTESKKDVLVVPYEAIFTKKNGEKVIFTVKDGKAQSHIIQTGLESDLVVEIIGKDIKEKDGVIMNPTENLRDGTPVVENQVMKHDKN